MPSGKLAEEGAFGHLMPRGGRPPLWRLGTEADVATSGSTVGQRSPGPVSEPLYEVVCEELVRLGTRVERNEFGADMRVTSGNDGPVTLTLETP